MYETPSYSSNNGRGNISDDAFCTLICAIFNKYHNVIHTPLQALSIFLAEYSSLDWSKNLVCVHGIIPLPPPRADDEGVVLHFSLTEAMNAPGQLLVPGDIQRLSDYFVATEVVERVDYSSIPATYLVDTNRDKQERENKHGPDCFRIKCMNIVHPLCPTMNLVSTSINNHKFHHFVHELKTGASALEKSLTSARLVCSYVYLYMRIYVLCICLHMNLLTCFFAYFALCPVVTTLWK